MTESGSTDGEQEDSGDNPQSPVHKIYEESQFAAIVDGIEGTNLSRHTPKPKYTFERTHLLVTVGRSLCLAETPRALAPKPGQPLQPISLWLRVLVEQTEHARV